MLVLLLSAPQVFEAFEKLRAILSAVELALQDAFLQALMVNEVPTRQSPQEQHLSRSTLLAAQIFGSEVHLAQGINVVADVARDVGISCSHEVKELAGIFLDLAQLSQHFIIEVFAPLALNIAFELQLSCTSLFCASPSPVCILAHKRVLYMLSSRVAWLTKLISSAQQAFMRRSRNGFQPASCTIKLYANFLTLFPSIFSLFTLQIIEETGRELSSAHRTVDCSAFLSSVTSPHSQAFEVKIVATPHTAPTQAHIFAHLLLAHWTHCLFPQCHPLSYYFFIFSLFSLLFPPLQPLAWQFRHFFPHFWKKRTSAALLDLRVLACEQIFELTVNVSGLPDDGIVDCHAEDAKQDVDGVNAVVIALRRAGTTQIRTYLSAVLVIETILECKGQRSPLPHQKERDA